VRGAIRTVGSRASVSAHPYLPPSYQAPFITDQFAAMTGAFTAAQAALVLPANLRLPRDAEEYRRAMAAVSSSMLPFSRSATARRRPPPAARRPPPAASLRASRPAAPPARLSQIGVAPGPAGLPQVLICAGEDEARREDMSLDGRFDATCIHLALVSEADLAAGDPCACFFIHIPDFFAGHPAFDCMKLARYRLARSLDLVSRGEGRPAAGMTGMTSSSQTARTAGNGVARFAHHWVKNPLLAVYGFPCELYTDAAEIELVGDLLMGACAAMLALRAPGAAARNQHAAQAVSLCGLTIPGTGFTSCSYTVSCSARKCACTTLCAARSLARPDPVRACCIPPRYVQARTGTTTPARHCWCSPPWVSVSLTPGPRACFWRRAAKSRRRRRRRRRRRSWSYSAADAIRPRAALAGLTPPRRRVRADHRRRLRHPRRRHRHRARRHLPPRHPRRGPRLGPPRRRAPGLGDAGERGYGRARRRCRAAAGLSSPLPRTNGSRRRLITHPSSAPAPAQLKNLPSAVLDGQKAAQQGFYAAAQALDASGAVRRDGQPVLEELVRAACRAAHFVPPHRAGHRARGARGGAHLRLRPRAAAPAERGARQAEGRAPEA
jgi:hypothetical protein